MRAQASWRRRWNRRRRRLYARHRFAANAAMIAVMLLGIAAQQTITEWLMAGAPAGRAPLSGHLMARPPTPDGAVRGTVRFEPEAPTGRIAGLLAARGRPESVESATSHGGRWSIAAGALRRGWTYRIETRIRGCRPHESSTIRVPLLGRARIPPLTAESCGQEREPAPGDDR